MTKVFFIVAFVSLAVLSDSLVFSKEVYPKPAVEKREAPYIKDETYKKAARKIAYWEGFYPCPKADPVGHATIGYGHLIHYGPPTQQDFDLWGCISKKKGKAMLARDLRQYDLMGVLSEYGIDLPRSSDRQIALISFIYNLGVNVLDTGHDLRAALQRRSGVAGQIRRYVYAASGDGPVKLPGLVRRRAWEASLFAGAK